jgi:DNA-directed RNA polymerase sigma subunit (sigma70/sigma32)
MIRSRLTLERELRDLLGRKARIAARYYGFDGRGGGTLQSVGNEIGVTRERVRQIAADCSRRIELWKRSRGIPRPPRTSRSD